MAAAQMQGLADALPELLGTVKIKPAGGEKGLGLFAVEDIIPGQVLLVSRAMGFDHCQDVAGSHGARGPPDSRCTSDLVHQIANKIHFDDDSSSSSEFYRLSAGSHLGPLEDAPASVVVARIRGILDLNTHLSSLLGLGEPFDQCGFWLLPSFINNSCSEHNCIKEEYENVLIVKAVSTIPIGGEVLWEYVPGFWPHEEKQAGLRGKWGERVILALKPH